MSSSGVGDPAAEPFGPGPSGGLGGGVVGVVSSGKGRPFLVLDLGVILGICRSFPTDYSFHGTQKTFVKSNQQAVRIMLEWQHEPSSLSTRRLHLASKRLYLQDPGSSCV